MFKITGLIALALCLGACTPRDKQETREDLRKSGNAVKKELKNDAAFLKQEALKARAETQKDVKKLKKEVNSNDTAPRHPSDRNPDSQ